MKKYYSFKNRLRARRKIPKTGRLMENESKPLKKILQARKKILEAGGKIPKENLKHGKQL